MIERLSIKGVNRVTVTKVFKIYSLYSYAKFHQDLSDGLDFYEVRIYIYIYCALYIRLQYWPFLRQEQCSDTIEGY